MKMGEVVQGNRHLGSSASGTDALESLLGGNPQVDNGIWNRDHLNKRAVKTFVRLPLSFRQVFHFVENLGKYPILVKTPIQKIALTAISDLLLPTEAIRDHEYLGCKGPSRRIYVEVSEVGVRGHRLWNQGKTGLASKPRAESGFADTDSP